LKHLLYPLLANTGIHLLKKGSPEGISDLVAERRNCIIIWDEAGEIASDKSGQYRTIDKLFNTLYDLDGLGKHVVTRSAKECPAWEYYASVIFVCTDKQWKAITKKFEDGGFTRRFLQLKLKRYREPFEIRELDEQAVSLAGKINAYIHACRNLSIAVNPPEFPESLKKKLLEIPESNRDLIEAYTTKVTVSCMINECLNTEVLRSYGHGVSDLSQYGIEKLNNTSLNFMTLYDLYCPNMTIHDLMTYDQRMTSMTNMTLSEVMRPFMTNYDLMTLLNLVSQFTTTPSEFVDEWLPDVLDKIREIKKTHPVLTRKEFSRLVLSGCPADKYMPVLKALSDMEEARIINHPKRDWMWVVLDPDFPTCPNCACWQNGLCTLLYSEEDRFRKVWKIKWHKGDKCEDFVPLQEEDVDE
jgi:hypothetical protein